AATVTARPATMIRASVSVGGACSVTGVTIRRTALSPRRHALTAKMRQKRETVRASIRPTLARSSGHGDRSAPGPGTRRGDQNRYRSLGLQLGGKPALKAATRPSPLPRADQDHIGSLLGGDLAEKRGRRANGDSALRSLRHAIFLGQLAE